MRNGSVTSAGVMLRYSIKGSGIPLLVVGSSIYYPRTFSENLKRSCTIACADLPHFAEPEEGFMLGMVDFDTYASDIEEVRRELGFEQVAVVGHSHHGNVALEYAKQFPERVSHVVMIGSPPVDSMRTMEAGTRYWEECASDERKRLLRKNHDALDAGQLGSLSPQAAFIAKYLADAPKLWYDPNYDGSSLWQGMQFEMDDVEVFQQLFEDYELTWGPESLEAPVLVVMGRHDYMVPHTLWDEFGAMPQNVTYRVLDRSGHTPQLEEPEAFDALLLDWLRG